MAVIINELEVELEPQPGKANASGHTPPPEKPTLTPLDLITVQDQLQRNHLRVMAH